ncbi:DUF4286 family protein [Bacteroidota bacterium]
MFLYNLTVSIEHDVEISWKDWIRGVYIPKVMATGLFSSVKLYRLIEDPNSDDATYSVQFFTDTIQDIEKFLKDEAPLLAAEHQQRFHHKHVAFRTVLQEEKL